MEDKIKKWAENLNIEPKKDLWNSIQDRLPEKRKKVSLFKKLFSLPYTVGMALICFAICLILISGYLFFVKNSKANLDKHQLEKKSSELNK
ncbi:MAG: hypothetical protein RLZZ546_1218 [Bacteroidota bacterium]|jgi:hypothetical protein